MFDKDEIIEMAKQAGGIPFRDSEIMGWGCEFDIEPLEAFAKLVADKVRKETLEEMIYEHPTTAIKKAIEYERETCAKICIDSAADYILKGHPASEIAAKALAIGATQIRARGEA